MSFEDLDVSDERLKRISNLIWKLLNEKFEQDSNSNSSSDGSRNSNSFPADAMNKSNTITLDQIVVPPIHVDSGRSEYDIALCCASAIYQSVLLKLH